MHVRHALPSLCAILNRNVEGRRAVEALERALHACDGEEEVGELGRGQVGEEFVPRERADEDVAGQEGFEVYEREGVGGCVEDLIGRDV